jgi:hypothetical protein
MVTDCNFTDNIAFRGAGIYVNVNGSATVEDTAFFENDANQDGGGIYLTKSNDVSVTDCHMFHNSAVRGAGLYTINSLRLNVTGCLFRLNTAPAVGFDPNDPNDPNAWIVGQGGAIYCWSTSGMFADCVLTHNIANASGGGMYLLGEPQSPDVLNCLIINNLAGRDGGGMSVNWSSRPFIRNCTFAGNACPGNFGQQGYTGFGGGLYCGYYSDCTVTSSIFWDNYALEGHEITVGTGFEIDRPWPSRLRISYSDVKGGQSEAKVDDGCNLAWGAGMIKTDPMFVTGQLGDHYLSQTAAGQSQNSPCVDTGSGDASHYGLTAYTTRTDEEFDTGYVDMGYHYPLSQHTAPCRPCDLVRDGIIDFYDYAALAVRWLDQGCSQGNSWCAGADITFDSYVNFEDLAIFVACWLLEDTVAPLPNPSEWKLEPYCVSTPTPSIAMQAKTTYDAWGWKIHYYFECTSNSAHNSGWQPGSSYVLSGLAEGTELCFRVRTIDGMNNVSGWSSVRCATVSADCIPPEDTTPPAPPPVLIHIEPNSPNSIFMMSRLSYDACGVEYYFECYSGDGHDSGWVTFDEGVQPTYVDVNLVADTNYCYRVKARDMSPNRNETLWSDVECAVTLEKPDDIPPEPDPMDWDYTLDANGFDGLPREILLPPYSYWDYGHTMRADPNTTDLSGSWEFYFECKNPHSGYSSGWISFPAGPPYTYTTEAMGPLGFEPLFRVKARDMWGNETAWSEWECSSCQPIPE